MITRLCAFVDLEKLEKETNEKIKRKSGRLGKRVQLACMGHGLDGMHEASLSKHSTKPENLAKKH